MALEAMDERRAVARARGDHPALHVVLPGGMKARVAERGQAVELVLDRAQGGLVGFDRHEARRAAEVQRVEADAVGALDVDLRVVRHAVPGDLGREVDDRNLDRDVGAAMRVTPHPGGVRRAPDRQLGVAEERHRGFGGVRDGAEDDRQAAIGDRLREALLAQRHELGIGFERHDAIPLAQVVRGVLAAVQADIEDQAVVGVRGSHLGVRREATITSLR